VCAAHAAVERHLGHLGGGAYCNRQRRGLPDLCELRGLHRGHRHLLLDGRRLLGSLQPAVPPALRLPGQVGTAMIRPFGVNEFLTIVYATQWTLLLSLIALVGGALGGLAIALMRTGSFPALRRLASAFIVTFQGTPLLMQLFLVFFGASVLGFKIDPWAAAAIGLTLHASAYLGDIWRGCIEAVPKGQWEAARALGLTYRTLMADVVLPQATRIAIPPTVG